MFVNFAENKNLIKKKFNRKIAGHIALKKYFWELAINIFMSLHKSFFFNVWDINHQLLSFVNAIFYEFRPFNLFPFVIKASHVY